MDLAIEKSNLIEDYNKLVGKYNKLVRQVNQLGDMWETRKAANTPFSKEQLNKLIRLCHPDKHGGSKLANEVTQFLLSIRR